VSSDSKIVTADELTLVSGWIANKKSSFSLVYRASRDGYRASDFHRCANQYNRTVVFIKADTGARFGGFSNKSWQGNGVFMKSPGCFIFQMDMKKKLDLKSKDHWAVTCNPNFGPIFGGGSGYDLLIWDNCNTKNSCYSELGSNYDVTKIS